MHREQPTIIPIAFAPVGIVCVTHSLMTLWYESVSVHVVRSCCQVFIRTRSSFDAMRCYSNPNEIQYRLILIWHVARGERVKTIGFVIVSIGFQFHVHMRCSDFTNCADAKPQTQKGLIPMPGRSQPPASGIFGQMGKEKETASPTRSTFNSRGSHRFRAPEHSTRIH